MRVHINPCSAADSLKNAAPIVNGRSVLRIYNGIENPPSATAIFPKAVTRAAIILSINTDLARAPCPMRRRSSALFNRRVMEQWSLFTVINSCANESEKGRRENRFALSNRALESSEIKKEAVTEWVEQIEHHIHRRRGLRDVYQRSWLSKKYKKILRKFVRRWCQCGTSET